MSNSETSSSHHSDKNDNPLGLLGLDHLAFCSDSQSGRLAHLFAGLGLQTTAHDPATRSILYSSHDVRFVLSADMDPNSHAHRYFKSHGEGVHKISFRVMKAEKALEEAMRRGGRLVRDLKTAETAEGPIRTASIAGVGDVENEFVERPSGIFRGEFIPIAASIPELPHYGPLKTPVARIDHLTNNVPKGEMSHWVNFYKQVFGFQVTRYFDIKGLKTGLISEVVQLQNGKIIIPVNEPDLEGGKSQIQEFLDLHRGPGVQHIALTTGHILSTVAELRNRELKFLSIPHTYYEQLPNRGIPFSERIQDLEDAQILVDGDEKGYLLQIFSENVIGPSFFEFIQRKNHQGFGEGNFQALFDAIERDQMKRGVL